MEDRREYYKQWRADNPKRVKELDKVKNEVHRERYTTDPQFKAHWKRTVALQRYKMTPKQFDDQFAEQGGHCALCEVSEGVIAQRKHSLHVDHDHKCCSGSYTCGKCRRGILCVSCNNRLAFLENHIIKAFKNPEVGEVDLRNSVLPDSWTSKALKYLNKYSG